MWCVGWLYWAWDTLHAYGLEPADGGLLKPYSERVQMAVIIAVLGTFPVAGMVYYSTLYLTKVERDGVSFRHRADRPGVIEFVWRSDAWIEVGVRYNPRPCRASCRGFAIRLRRHAQGPLANRRFGTVHCGL